MQKEKSKTVGYAVQVLQRQRKPERRDKGEAHRYGRRQNGKRVIKVVKRVEEMRARELEPRK